MLTPIRMPGGLRVGAGGRYGKPRGRAPHFALWNGRGIRPSMPALPHSPTSAPAPDWRHHLANA